MKIISTLVTLVFATALTSRAAVISQTVDFGSINGASQFYFNQFNTALGTLTGVELDWTVNSTISSAQITNENSGTVTVSKIAFTNSVQGYVPATDDSGTAVADINKSKTVSPNVALARNASYTVNNVTFSQFTQTDNYTSSNADFNSFKGTGTVPLYLTNSFGATVTASGSGRTNTWLTTITGSTTGHLGVVYTYTAAPHVAPVPEPPAMLLGFGGIIGMAGFAFKRRTKNTAAVLA